MGIIYEGFVTFYVAIIGERLWSELVELRMRCDNKRVRPLLIVVLSHVSSEGVYVLQCVNDQFDLCWWKV